MAFLSSLNIAASGMAAERLRLDVISQNVANAKTTRTEDGTPYRRQVVLFSENKGFNSVLEETIAKRKEKIAGGVPANTVSATKNKGVLVTEIVEDETMIIVAMEVTVNDSKSIVSFCMSAITMDQIMKKFSAKFSSGKRAGSPTKETERKENLMSTLSQSELTVTAVLDDTMLTLRDVLNLQVNDIIPLNKPITDNVQLKVGSTCWFDGKLGTLNGKKAFRIDNILKN